MILTKWPGVTREISTFFVKAYINPEVPIGSLNKISQTNVSPFGPAVWPAIDNICMNVLFYYIDRYRYTLCNHNFTRDPKYIYHLFDLSAHTYVIILVKIFEICIIA